MANKTLLDAVNEIGKRTSWLDTSNTGLLSSLTNSALQSNIDVAVQVVNEGLDELYTTSLTTMPGEGGPETTITLVTGQREYTLASDLVTLRWPMVDRVNTQYLFQWYDSYENFLLIDPQQIYTGLPSWGMISPITGKLRLDRAPDSTVNGRGYIYQYDRDVAVFAATDTLPFNNEAFRAMIPAWVQLYKREKRNEFDQSLYTLSVGRASRALTLEAMRTHYHPRG